MKTIRTWLALLLFVHVVVHPLVHAAPLLDAAYGHQTLSASVGDQRSDQHQCEVCRTANSVVPVFGFAALDACDYSSAVITDPTSEFVGVTQLHLPSRAPPVS